MSKPRFLCDENTDPALVAAIRHAEAAIDVMRVGDPGAPPLGTKDPDLLLAAESSGRVLVTMDRRSMPKHLVKHFAAGNHTAGVMMLRQGLTFGQYAAEIANHWSQTEADDWVDRTIFVP